MSAPIVSVVVATRDRPDRLARLLAGLRHQSVPPEQFEVIVVDDGSGPATAELLSAAGAPGGLRLRTLRQATPGGQAAARNRGWQLARAALVAFTDDDCVPEPRWVAMLAAAARAHPGAVIQGRTEADPADAFSHGNRVLTRTVLVEHAGPQYQTCNIAYPRSLLEALDGFDEAFGTGSAGEDTDLAWRALERGAEIVFADEAVVRHAVLRLSAAQGLRDAWRWGETARVFARHPGARVMLEHRLFWNVWHMLLIRSLLAAALPLPRVLRRLLLARHLRALRRRARGLEAGMASIPFLLLLDATETASMLRGAIRHGTPLL